MSKIRVRSVKRLFSYIFMKEMRGQRPLNKSAQRAGVKTYQGEGTEIALVQALAYVRNSIRAGQCVRFSSDYADMNKLHSPKKFRRRGFEEVPI